MHREVVGLRPRTRAARQRYWQGHLSAQAGSGLSQAEYCRRNRLSKSTFGWWKRKLQQPLSSGASLALVPLGVLAGPAPLAARQPPASSGLALVTVGGVRVEIGVDFHPPTLERVLRVMERLS